jgi:hypothetical protein
MNDLRVWTVYEHGGGRTVSSDQCDHWKEPLQVVALADLFAHPMFEGEGAIPKANVRFVLASALDEKERP